MPLVRFEETARGARFGIWRAEEPEAELRRLARLHPREEEECARISNDKRRRQWLAARAALRTALPETRACPVEKNARNAPSLPGSGLRVSFSHSGAYAAFAVSQHGPAAIDLEAADRRRGVGAARMFMSAEEQARLRETTSPAYYLAVWCAKECMFKALNDRFQEISFQRELKTFLKPAALAQPEGGFSGSFIRVGARAGFDLRFYQSADWLACVLDGSAPGPTLAASD